MQTPNGQDWIEMNAASWAPDTRAPRPPSFGEEGRPQYSATNMDTWLLSAPNGQSCMLISLLTTRFLFHLAGTIGTATAILVDSPQDVIPGAVGRPPGKKEKDSMTYAAILQAMDEGRCCRAVHFSHDRQRSVRTISRKVFLFS